MSKNFKEHKGLDLPKLAEEILDFWKEENIFEKSISIREGAEPFVFFEGPPSANGLPGIHHVMARAIKDIFCRYKTQKGFKVDRKAGWDTHGLPIELGVEKELGITKEDIGKKISVEDYNAACKKAVMRYTDVWNRVTESYGYWVDMSDPYVTYEPKYMETVWWLLKEIYNKNLLYKGYTIQPYSPKAGTGLSSHELNQPGTYQDITDTTVVAQFKAMAETLPDFLAEESNNIWFLAWTTTPWTLPSNTALTVGAKIDYVLVKTFNQYTFQPINVVLSKNLVASQFSHKQYFEINSESVLPYNEHQFDGRSRFEIILGRKFNDEEYDLLFQIFANRKQLKGTFKEVLKSTGYEFNDKQINLLEKAEINVRNQKFPYQVLKEFKGADLLGIRYEQLLDYALPFENPENAFRIIGGDFVTTEDGTGIVHTAPTFGADDAKVAMQAVPEVPPMLVPKVPSLNNFIIEIQNGSTDSFSGATFSNIILSDEFEEKINNSSIPLEKKILLERIKFKGDTLNNNEIRDIISETEIQNLIGDSWEKARKHILVPLVDLQGKFRPEMKELAGKYVKNEYYEDSEVPEKSVDVEIAIRLKTENKAFKVEKYVHSYPNCWRTDKPILYYPLDSWFIKVTDFRDRMFELNKEINWKPKATGEGRFGNWLANANDWNLSRSRYWGIPLPIWRTEDGKEEIIIGSVEELKGEMQKAVSAGLMQKDIFEDFKIGDLSEENYANVDLHKNIVDEIILVSPSGKTMKREADLIDVWFDSGSMPYAQWHYPFENKEKVENTWRKADFIAEGVDQTRGWFYTLHAIATMIFDDVAYKNVVSNGLVLDKNGQKMSKRLGNAVDPFETLNVFGPDATRWYMISNANPWDNLKFDQDGISEVRNKFFGTLYNTYSFFSLYANLDNFEYLENDLPLEKRPEIDRWILSELHTLIQKVDDYYADYEPTKATRAISEFVQENLSNWFVRLSRRRYWKGSYNDDKISAYQTLYTCLETVAKLGAPVAPFFMERLYRDLTQGTAKDKNEPVLSAVEASVHLTDFPKADISFIDKKLEHKMQKAQTISSLVLSLRQREKIKVRQPLQKIMIPVLEDSEKEEILAVSDLIKSEVNVKEIELIDEGSGMLVKQIKPDFKALGPRFGKDMKAVAEAISGFDQKQIATLEKDGEITVSINEKNTTLALDDVMISSQDIEGWLVANTNGVTVALDVTITPDLKNEGIARELVNRIQNLRKDSGFEVTDRIEVTLQDNEIIKVAVNQNLQYIKEETLTEVLQFQPKVEQGTEIAFDDIETRISIKKN